MLTKEDRARVVAAIRSGVPPEQAGVEDLREMLSEEEIMECLVEALEGTLHTIDTPHGRIAIVELDSEKVEELGLRVLAMRGTDGQVPS